LVREWGKKLAGILLAGVIACAASAASVGGGRAPRLQVVHADTAALRRKLDSIADAHHGIIGYSVIISSPERGSADAGMKPSRRRAS